MTLSPRQSQDDATQRIARMDSIGVEIQVLSLTWRLFLYDLPARVAVPIAEQVNEDMATLIQAHPTRFRAFAQLPLQDPDESIRSLERWMAVDGFVGACLGTDVDGREWDDAVLFPVLEAAQALGAVLFFHPADRRPDARLARFHLQNLIGNPLETTIAIAALIFGGVLDRLPDVRMCFAHAGGFAPAGIGRFDHGYTIRPETRAVAAHLPSEYLRRLSFDSVTHGEIALRRLIDTVGIDRVVLGSDDPADMGVLDPVGFVRGCTSLTEAEQSAIIGSNAQRLLARVT
jgi:aminocarboxymuconate-semialdehyde decarboxylase